MKFSNGCWLQKEGVQLFAPAEAYFITKTETEVTICAPTGRVYNKGCTLGGINLTVKVSSPRKDVLRVQTYHHLGAVVAEPAFELNVEACPLTVTEDEASIEVASGSLSLLITKEPWSMTYKKDGKVLTQSTGAKSKAQILGMLP